MSCLHPLSPPSSWLLHQVQPMKPLVQVFVQVPALMCDGDMQILPLAAAFVGYIVFWNLSLQLNSVGFYQLSKILIAPAIIIIEAVWFSKLPSRLELAAVALLCIGVTLATVSDSEVSTDSPRFHAKLFQCTAWHYCKCRGHSPS